MKMGQTNEYCSVEPQQKVQSIETILSSSIQRAKEKINQMESKRQDLHHPPLRSIDKKERTNSLAKNDQTASTGAIANAMKILQNRITELQKNIQNHQRQRTIVLKEMDNLSSEKQIILTNFEETNKKNNHLEQAIKNYKTESKELQKKIETFSSSHMELESKIKEYELSIKILQKQKNMLQQNLQTQSSISKKQNQNVHNTFNHKMSQSEMLYQAKTRELDDWEKNIKSQEEKIKEKEHILIASEKNNHKIKELELYKKDLEIKNHDLSQNVEDLKKELTKIKNQNYILLQKITNSEQDEENNNEYQNRIMELQSQLEELRQTTRNLSKSSVFINSSEHKSHYSSTKNQNHRFELLKEELHELKIKYDEVFHVNKKLQEKIKKEEMISKNYRSKFWEMKDILDEIIQKINKLPGASTKQLKYLVIKANKIQSVQLQRISAVYTPTKSRTNSVNQGRSSSKSKKKNTERLNSSRNSADGSVKKSKKLENTSAKKSTKKEVILSTTNRSLHQNQNVFNSLEKQLQDMRKQYKALVKKMNENENQDIRNKLNCLAFEIQEKSEEITKIKRLKLK